MADGGGLETRDSDEALAVGQATDPDRGDGMAEHWDGHTWAAVVMRNPAFQNFSSLAPVGAAGYWGSMEASGNKHTTSEKYVDDDWGPRVNGDRAPKRESFSYPRTLALAHVPGTHRTLAVGFAEGYASSTSTPTFNAGRESTAH